jgi:hypothetical protein
METYVKILILASIALAFALASLTWLIYNQVENSDKKCQVGDKGEQGEEGDTGQQGVQGVQGVQGDQGDQGVPGARGAKGDRGVRGPPGEPPNAIFFDEEAITLNNEGIIDATARMYGTYNPSSNTAELTITGVFTTTTIISSRYFEARIPQSILNLGQPPLSTVGGQTIAGVRSPPFGGFVAADSGFASSILCVIYTPSLIRFNVNQKENENTPGTPYVCTIILK